MTADRASRSFAAGNFPCTSFDEMAMLDRIGNDLRNLYGSVANSEPPGDLLQLANLIDAKRQVGSKKDDRNPGAA